MALGKQAKTITDRQAKAVLNHLADARHPGRDRVVFLLSIKAGLRSKEIANLTWGMVTDSDAKIADVIAVLFDMVTHLVEHLGRRLGAFRITRPGFALGRNAGRHQRFFDIGIAAERADHVAGGALGLEARSVAEPRFEDVVVGAFEVKDNHLGVT